MTTKTTHIKKNILAALLMSASISSFAYFDYIPFQRFDNQIGFGMNAQQGNFSLKDTSYSMVAMNLEVEKLFDVGLWLDVNASNIQTYTQTRYVNPVGSFPFIATLNAKIGYNIAYTDFFALTPYINLGKNANITTFTSILGGTVFHQGVSQDYFYSPGLGLRLEFPINKYVYLFLDQLYVYNYDQSNLHAEVDTPEIISLSNSQWTTTLGVKVNLWQDLQLAANVFYTNYNDFDSNTKNVLASNPDDNNLGVPTTAIGIQGSVGFTFK